MSKGAFWRVGRTSVWLGLALLSGCAQWSDLSLALRRSGEIRGRVETPISQNLGRSRLEERAIIVFLEPATDRFSLKLRQEIRRILIRTGQRSPEVQLVTIDQPFRFHNLDSIHHELFTADPENKLRVRLKGRSESEILSLTSPSLIQLFCALHPDENHTLIVSAGRKHVFLDADWRFRITDVRPGLYRIRAANADNLSQLYPVNVQPAETVEVMLRLAPIQND